MQEDLELKLGLGPNDVVEYWPFPDHKYRANVLRMWQEHGKGFSIWIAEVKVLDSNHPFKNDITTAPLHQIHISSELGKTLGG